MCHYYGQDERTQLAMCHHYGQDERTHLAMCHHYGQDERTQLANSSCGDFNANEVVI